MRGAVLVAFVFLAASGGELAAQAPAAPPPAAEPPAPAPPLSEAAKAMIGTWDFSNADRDKVCTITFADEPRPSGMKVEFDPTCAGLFTFVGDVVAWTLAENDFLRLLDASGQSVLEFSEVESGIYEAPRPEEGILFIQSAAAAGPPPRTAEQMAGDWSIVRGAGTPVCALTLEATPAGDDLALRVTPPCDAFVTQFGPATWQMDRSELVLKSARGQAWRFEQGDDDKTWRRIPETADPVLMMRK